MIGWVLFGVLFLLSLASHLFPPRNWWKSSVGILSVLAMGALYVWGVVGKEVLIDVKTANNEQTIQWTGLGSTYDTLFLQCHDLTPSHPSPLYLEYAEGSIPTWQASEYQSLSQTTAGAVPVKYPGGPGIIILSWDTQDVTSFTSFNAQIDNVHSSSRYKTASGSGETNSTSSYSTLRFDFEGTYVGDKNPVTGIRVITGGPPLIGGTCALYGRSLDVLSPMWTFLESLWRFRRAHAHVLSLATAFGAMIAGGLSAWFWWQSTRIEFAPFEPETWMGPEGQGMPARMRAVDEYVTNSSKANSKAAIWSGLTALLAGISTLLCAL